MKFRDARALFVLLPGFVLVALGVAGAQQLDAVTIAAQTDPARVETGSVRVPVTAVIKQSMVVEYNSPLTLDTPARPGQAAAPDIVLANTAGRPGGRADRENEISTSIAIRGAPNQAYAVSVTELTRLTGARNDTGFAVVSHDAGSTPRIGPEGDTKFVIVASIDLGENMRAGNYTGTLDLIVSHN